MRVVRSISASLQMDASSSMSSPISMDDERFRVLAIPSDSFWLPKLTFFGNSTKQAVHRRLASYLLRERGLEANNPLAKPHMLLLLPLQDSFFTPTKVGSSSAPHPQKPAARANARPVGRVEPVKPGPSPTSSLQDSSFTPTKVGSSSATQGS